MYCKEKKEHAFKVFNRDIKAGNISNVILMHGVEGYLINWAAHAIINRFVGKPALNLDVVKFFDDISVRELIETCETLSLFSDKRVVWAREFPLLKSLNPKGYSKKDIEAILDYINGPNEGTILIFSTEEMEPKSELVKALKTKACCYEFGQLDYSSLAAFAGKRFALEGIGITRDLLKVLIDESGYFNRDTEYRLYNFVNDIKKIIAHCQGQEVGEEDITLVLNGDLDKFVFNLVDAVSTNRKDKAFELLSNILNSGKDVYSITGLLINHFELLLEVSQFKIDGAVLSEIVKTLKINEFRVKKAMSFCEKFTAEKIKSILCQLYEVDRNIKTGLLDQRMALELIIGRI